MTYAKITTKHPEPGKQGVRISQAKYEAVREAILESLQANSEMTFTELTNVVQQRLASTFEGSISWYVTTVKLDLEARNEIRRVPRTRPQRLRLVTD